MCMRRSVENKNCLRKAYLKKLGLVIFSVMFVTGAAGNKTITGTFAAEKSEIIANDENGIPDKALYDVVSEAGDTNKDGILTKQEAAEVVAIDAAKKGIKDIRGLQYLTGLKRVYLQYNEIRSLDSLSSFEELYELELNNNQISDISVLKDLTVKYELDLSNNQISDISSLNISDSLIRLNISNNQISDISVLKDSKITENILCNMKDSLGRGVYWNMMGEMNFDMSNNNISLQHAYDVIPEDILNAFVYTFNKFKNKYEVTGIRWIDTQNFLNVDKNGVYKEDGEIRYYVNGVKADTYTGMAKDNNGKTYWFDEGVAAVSKQVYNPDDDAWYWFEADGTMAYDKDVYVPESNENRKEGKWVRYDENGHMVKGEDYRYDGWYLFDEITGEMVKGFYTVYDDEEIKDYYYNDITGQMEHGAVNIGGIEYAFDDVTGIAVNNKWYVADGIEYWYEKGVRQGMEGRGKEIYDPESNGWYWLDSAEGGKKAVSKDVYQESFAGQFADREDKTGKWVRYDENGCMIKGWSEKGGNIYYFDPQTGAMAKGCVNIDGQDYCFDENTGIKAI